MPLTWEKFTVENPHSTDAFETLAKRFFAAECAVDSAQIMDPAGYPGVECKPIYVNGSWISYQAKFSEDELASWTKLETSLKVACKKKNEGIYELDCVYVIVNWKIPQKRKEGGKDKVAEFDKLAKENGFSLKWYFGKNILERIETSENSNFKRLKRFFFTNPPQPSLEKPKSNPSTGIAKYHYSSTDGINFIERKNLSTELSEFISQDRSFSWHIITADAGMGKSRSILHFCSQLDDTWNWGWLSKSTSFDFENWKPSAHTIIIVDYAMGRMDQLSSLMAQLVTMQETLDAKVRIIIAERMVEPWLELLVMRQTIGPQLTSAAFRRDGNDSVLPHKLAPFSENQNIALAEAILVKTPNLNMSSTELVSNTKELDIDCRPLIMWLFADMAENQKTFSDAESLLDAYLKRQRKNNWEPAGVSLTDEEDTACITMCGGVSLDPSKIVNPVARKFCGAIDISAHQTILGSVAQSDVLKPFEPDMIGELHALDVMNGLNIFDTEAINRIFNNAVSVDGGKGLIGFLFRAANNFPNHPSFEKLRYSEINASWYGKLVQMLVLALNNPGPKRSQERLWKILEGFVKKTEAAEGENQQTLARDLAACAVNASHGFDAQEYFIKADELVDLILGFAQIYNDGELFKRHAMAQDNILRDDKCSTYSDSRRIEKVTGWLGLFENPFYPVAAKRQLVRFSSTQFHNTLNKDNFSDGGLSRDWLNILCKAVNAFEDEHDSSQVFTNALVENYQKLIAGEHFSVTPELGHIIIEYQKHLSKHSASQFGSFLFSQTQKLQNGLPGDPQSYLLLTELASFHPEMLTLLEHAYNPNIT